ncbi:hypothetical protein KI387_022779 [Taxus chinensis]|uniref:RRM domain-containing protein n=1 Tax=Taxus chinensis TaxID=29808 RepID=A0AA38LAZ3_TAXCH|nr:hypothetical protein KI387_022779 [Taxus chinensis]
MPNRYQSSSSSARGKKLYISNLHYKVDDEDMDMVFSDCGRKRLESARVHFDEKGRSLGTGEVIFAREEDVVAAVNKYSGRILDGRPLKIHLLREEGNTNANK